MRNKIKIALSEKARLTELVVMINCFKVNRNANL